MVRVVVGHKDLGDLVGVQAIGAHVLEYAIPAIEACVDHPELVPGVDYVDIGIETVRQVVPVVAAADDVEVFINLHFANSSSGIEYE